VRVSFYGRAFDSGNSLYSLAKDLELWAFCLTFVFASALMLIVAVEFSIVARRLLHARPPH
jgi:hypothetical protein